MPLNVAVQMDPIERINIRGDSTFALLLEAQRRGHTLAYYTPDKLAMRDGKVFASVRPLSVQDTEGDHVKLGDARRGAREVHGPAADEPDPRARLEQVRRPRRC